MIAPLTLAGEVEHIVLEEQFNRGEREGCEVEILCIDDVVVSVLAGEPPASGGFDGQPPYLKLFGLHSLFAILCGGDGID